MLHVEQDSLQTSISEIISVCNQNGIKVSEEQASSLTAYVKSLEQWNERINLVSRADMKKIWVRHILHSVAPFMKFCFPEGLKVIDVGTGGGLPGVPFAILRPDFQVTLIDSIRKKTHALQAIIRDIGLRNARVVNGRVEERGKSKQFRQHFDLALSRGVSRLSTLVEWAGPLLKKQTSSFHSKSTDVIRLPAIIAFKGGDISSEVSEALKKHPNIDFEIHDLVFEGIDQSEMVEKKLVVAHMQVRS